MKDHSTAVSPVEYVLRRVPKKWCEDTLPRKLMRVAFEPHKDRDKDGLSVYREELLCSRELIEVTQRPAEFYIARIYVRDLLSLGLTVLPSPGDLPGHAVIPELNSATQKATKEIQLQLAQTAAAALVYTPDDPRPDCCRISR